MYNKHSQPQKDIFFIPHHITDYSSHKAKYKQCLMDLAHLLQSLHSVQKVVCNICLQYFKDLMDYYYNSKVQQTYNKFDLFDDYHVQLRQKLALVQNDTNKDQITALLTFLYVLKDQHEYIRKIEQERLKLAIEKYGINYNIK